MTAGEKTAYFFRSIYFAVFVFSSLLVLISIDPSMFDFTQVFKIVEYLMLFVQELLRLMTTVAYNLTWAFLNFKADLPFIGDPDFPVGFQPVLDIILQLVDPENSFFPHSNLDLTDLAVLFEDFFNFFGATAILILLPIAFLSGLGFLREGDTKLAVYSFLGFQLILIISIFTNKIIISTDIDSSNLFSMIFSPIFTLGFLLYLLLEIAFQTSYTLNIITPMAEREKRIQKHLQRIRTFVPPSQEETRTGGDEQSVQSVQSKKYDLLAASYLREMVERRMFKTSETAMDAKSTMRLQSYLASLNQNDPQTDLKLAAKTAQPDVSALLRHFAPAMAFRLISVILLSYFIMAPEGILDIFLSVSFPALLDSLELSQPEFRTIAILNVALLFILISAILSYFTSGRTQAVLQRVVQQIDTLVDFDRGTTPVAADIPEEESLDDSSEEEAEEEIS